MASNASSGGITQQNLDYAINTLKTDLTNGAASALDTFSELASALGKYPNFASTIATGLSNRVRFDDSQTLTAAQKLQSCNNIGIGNYDHYFVNDYNTAKA